MWRSSWGAVLRKVVRLLRAPLRRVICLSRHQLRHRCPRVLRLLGPACRPVLVSLERAASLRPTKRPCLNLLVRPMSWEWAATREPTTHPGLKRRAAIFGEACGIEKGGVPRTDHASLCADVVDGMAATCSPYRPGRLATQTATSDPVSPGLNLDFAVSRSFGHGIPEVRDGLPSIGEVPEFRDGLPSSGDFKGQAHPGAKFMNSSPDCKSTAFSCISRVAEKSEEVRLSDFRVQNLPASVRSSELSAQ